MNEVELLREIITMQKLQIEKYDIYINLFLKNTKCLEETNTKLISGCSIYESIDKKTSNIDIENIINLLEAPYPSTDNLVKIYKICIEKTFFTYNKKENTIEFYDVDSLEIVSFNDFANKMGMYIFGKFVNNIQNCSSNSNVSNDLNYEKDNNRVQNISLFKIKENQISILKQFLK